MNNIEITNEPLAQYIASKTELSEILEKAQADATEYGMHYPNPITVSLIQTLAAATVNTSSNAIAVCPALGFVGLHLSAALGETGHLTMIDPESEHQAAIKQRFREAGIAPKAFRLLPSRPLEVMRKLAPNNYGFIYGDVIPLNQQAFIQAAWPLLKIGGILVLGESLLDGTFADPDRKDRDSMAVRETWELINSLSGQVTRLPLGAGLTVITKQ